MNSKVIESFEKLRYKLGNGDYASKFDAMSIASLELKETKRISEKAQVNILGIEKLCSDINQVLNSAAIDQQAILALANDEYNLLVQLCEKMKFDNDSNHLQAQDGDMSWDTLPDAIKADVAMEFSSFSSLLLRRDLHVRFQKLHDDVQLLMESKLSAFEYVESLMLSYADELAELASESSQLPGAERKVRLVLEPRALTLTSHRFLDTSETRDLLRLLRELAANTYLKGNVDLAECKFSVENRKALTVGGAGLVDFSLSSFKIGAVCLLLLWGTSECLNNEKMGRDIWHDPTFSIFICLGDLTLLLIMWGVSLRVWRLAGINYIKLLSLENTDLASPALSFRPEQAEQIVLNSATDLSLVLLSAFILFNKALRGAFSFEGEPAAAHAIPAALLVFYIVRFFFPLQSRRVYLDMLWKVLSAPFHPVVFRDGYVGDLLTSLVRVSVNLSFSIAYVILTAYWWVSNHLNRAESVHSPTWQHSQFYRFCLIPFLTLFPLWIRLMQCLRRSVETGKRWPHYFNALKYCSAMVVFSFAAFRPHIQTNPIWILGLVGATCYQFAWDITMDWGLVQLSPDGRLIVRRQRSVCSDAGYAGIALFNFILRFSWAITFLPDLQRYSTVYWYVFNNFQTLMAAAEVVRRMVWGFLRLEWEHIEKYGSAPMSPSRQEALRREQAKVGRRVREHQEEYQPVRSKEVDPLSVDMEKMAVAGDNQANRSSLISDAIRTMLDWEWANECPDVLNKMLAETPLLGNYSSGRNFSGHIWLARIIEACVLSVAISVVIIVAALGSSWHDKS